MDFYVRKTDLELSQKKKEAYDKYSDLIQWGRRSPVQFAEEVIGIELLDYQRYCFVGSWDKQYSVLCMGRNSGKALDLETLIPVPSGGYKTMRELEVGDYVFDENGNPVRIIATSPIFYNHDCYKLTFDDREEIIADAEHLWEVKTQRKDKQVLTTKQLETRGVTFGNVKKQYKFRIKMNKPLQYPEKQFKIPPYVLGLWLGDGTAIYPNITSHKDDYEEIKSYIEQEGYNTTAREVKPNIFVLRVGSTGRKGNKPNVFFNSLKEYNLINNKHIPEEYLYGSVEQRLALLQGLMDTDGSCDDNYRKGGVNSCEFAQSDYRLIKQVSQLLTSLGIKHTMTDRMAKFKGKEFKSYRIYFVTDKTFPCFRMKRKYDRLPEQVPNKRKYKSLRKLEKVESRPTKCIVVDSPTHLFLCGAKATVTHNSFLMAPFIFTKMLLFPNFTAYILSVTAQQSQDTFLKIERMALRQIESMVGLTDFMIQQIQPSVNGNGFIHAPSGFTFKLFNGSSVTTCSGDETNLRGKELKLSVLPLYTEMYS